MQDMACCRSDLLRVRIAQHCERHLRLRALEQIYVYGRLWWRIGAVIMHVTYNANNREQPEVAVHIAKFNGLADRILAEPVLACEGYAYERGMRRVRTVAIVKHSPAHDRNAEGLKISVSCDTKIRFPELLFSAEELVEVAGEFL